MSEVFYKLTDLGIRPLKGEFSKKCDDFEGRIASLSLPGDYKYFINSFSVTSVFDKDVYFVGKQTSPGAEEGKEFLEVLFADCSDNNNDLFKIRELYLEQIPNGLLVIGEVTGGSLLCLELGDGSSAVKLWDKNNVGSIDDNMYLVSNSFSEFIKILVEEVETPQENKPQLKSFELSNDLKAKAEAFLKRQKK